MKRSAAELLRCTAAIPGNSASAGALAGSAARVRATARGRAATVRAWARAPLAGFWATLVAATLGCGWPATPPAWGKLPGVVMTVHQFNGESEGGHLHAGLTVAPDGESLYGAAYFGGSNDQGAIFRLGYDGTLDVVYVFPEDGRNGANPASTLLLAPDGNLYGTAYQGGSHNQGTLFRLNVGGRLHVVHHFGASSTDGANPMSNPLLLGRDGNLYGATFGADGNSGVVYRLGLVGQTYQVLYQFASGGSTGDTPVGSLVQLDDGSLCGVTEYGGDGGRGTIFRLTPDGACTAVHRFAGPDGFRPRTLLRGLDGDWYGVTYSGGDTFDRGTVFRLSPTEGTLTSLRQFRGFLSSHPAESDSGGPIDLFQLADGTLYGVTYRGGTHGAGTVYRLQPDGSAYTLIHSFSGITDGAYSQGSLVAAPDGSLYGTTRLGGSSDEGTVFRVLLPPVITNHAAILKVRAWVGQPFTFQFTARGYPASFKLVKGVSLPAGLSWDAAIGRLSGTPAARGRYRPAFRAVNAAGAGPVVTLKLKVSSACQPVFPPSSLASPGNSSE